MVEIRRISVGEFFSSEGIDELLSAYALESSLPEIGHATAQIEQYTHLEAMGVIHFVGLFAASLIVGVITIIPSKLPHYAERIATTESFFILAGYRTGGYAKKLLEEAERLAAELGAKALLVSAPEASTLDKVLPLWGFRPSHRTYSKALA